MEYTSKMTVTNEKTAQSCGSGDMPVLATPFLTAVMENAAMLCLAPTLAQGVTTVGVEINVKHLAPSALGSEITATATLIKTDGRSYDFEIKAFDGETLVGTATHTRVSVKKDKFMAKLGQ